MDTVLYYAHLDVGRVSGEEKTCGNKHRFPTEEKAIRATAAHNRWAMRRHDVEHYPCFFCQQWHVGRIMDIELRENSPMTTYQLEHLTVKELDAKIEEAKGNRIRLFGTREEYRRVLTEQVIHPANMDRFEFVEWTGGVNE